MRWGVRTERPSQISDEGLTWSYQAISLGWLPPPPGGIAKAPQAINLAMRPSPVCRRPPPPSAVISGHTQPTGMASQTSEAVQRWRQRISCKSNARPEPRDQARSLCFTPQSSCQPSKTTLQPEADHAAQTTEPSFSALRSPPQTPSRPRQLNEHQRSPRDSDQALGRAHHDLTRSLRPCHCRSHPFRYLQLRPSEPSASMQTSQPTPETQPGSTPEWRTPRQPLEADDASTRPC